jgi:hypothetical protein
MRDGFDVCGIVRKLEIYVGAQINFAARPPYLTYGFKRSSCCDGSSNEMDVLIMFCKGFTFLQYR